MLISRDLANKVNNRLQMILTLVEMQQKTKAIDEIQSLSAFLYRFVETPEEEQRRLQH